MPSRPPRARDFKALVRARLDLAGADPLRAGDIVDELAQHVAQHHADLVAAGLDEDEALAQVLAPLDDREHVATELLRRDGAPLIARLTPARYGAVPPAVASSLL